jgi:chitinase
MQPLKLITILLTAMLNLSTFAEAIGQTEAPKLVGYYSLARAKANRDKLPLRELTHINLWFLNPDSLGNFPADTKDTKSFIDKAHKKNVAVLFSIGGGSPHPEYHELLKPAKRQVLISNLVDIVIETNADGIDVDLEGALIDENYEGFVTELKDRLHSSGKMLTAAIAVYYKNQLTDKALAQFDLMNIMSYDRTGPWRPDRPGPHAPYEAAVEDLDYFLSRGIPREKLTLGVPFYGYSFDHAQKLGPGSMNYGEIVKDFKKAGEKDEITLPDGRVLYYNGRATIIRKARLAKEKVSGVMIWQIMGDAKGKRSLVKAISKELRRR